MFSTEFISFNLHATETCLSFSASACVNYFLTFGSEQRWKQRYFLICLMWCCTVNAESDIVPMLLTDWDGSVVASLTSTVHSLTILKSPWLPTWWVLFWSHWTFIRIKWKLQRGVILLELNLDIMLPGYYSEGVSLQCSSRRSSYWTLSKSIIPREVFVISPIYIHWPIATCEIWRHPASHIACYSRLLLQES